MIREERNTPRAAMGSMPFLPGTVAVGGVPGASVSVRLDGDSEAGAMLNATDGTLSVAQRVYCLLPPPHGAVVIGVISPASESLPHSNSQRVVITGTRTTTSATYVVVPTDQVIIDDFVKRFDDTVLIAECAGTFAHDPGGARLGVGVRINGTDYDLVTFGNTANLLRATIAGISDPITGVNAGTYDCELVVKISAGTLSFFNADDFLSLKITETYQ